MKKIYVNPELEVISTIAEELLEASLPLVQEDGDDVLSRDLDFGDFEGLSNEGSPLLNNMLFN